METPPKLDFKRIFPIFIIVVVDLLGLSIIIPLLPLYATTFGADPLMIGIIGAAYPTMQLIGGPLLGGLSDRFGRKPILMISQLGTLTGFLLLGFANGVPLLLLSRLIDGLSGGNRVAAQAAITDMTTPATRAQGLGLLGAGFGLGFTLGPAIAGISLALTDNNFHVPAFIAAGFSLLSILLTTFWFTETLTPERRAEVAARGPQDSLLRRLARASAIPVVAVLLVVMFVQRLVFSGFENLLALFTLSRLGISGAGNAIIFMLVGIVIVLVQAKYIGVWTHRFGERRLVFAGLALVAAGMLITATTPRVPVNWYSEAELRDELSREDTEIAIELPAEENRGWIGLAWVLVAMIPAAVGGGLLMPSINSLITRSVPASETGGMLGVSSSLVSLANAITPVLGGAIFGWLGASAPYFIGSVVIVVLLGVTARALPET